jgi:hypothetical protein
VVEDARSQTEVPAHYRVGWSHFSPLIAKLAGLYVVVSWLTMRFGEMHHFVIWAATFLVVYILWIRGRMRREREHNELGMRLMSTGEHAAAGELFEALCRRPVSMTSHMMLIFNRAVAYQCEGDYDQALALYRSALDTEGRASRRVMAVHGDLLRARAAEGFAWAGDLDTAEALLAQLGPDVKDPEALVAPRALIALRRGDAEGALGIIEAGWGGVEGALSGTELSPLKILYAYTLQTLDREGDPAWAHQLDITPEEATITAWAGGRWPEMATFVEGLQAPP